MRNLKLIVSTGSLNFDFVSQIVSGKQILSSDSHVKHRFTHQISFKITDAQWRDLSKFEDAKVRFLVRSEVPIEQQKDPKNPGSADNFYMKCAGGVLINWKVASEELARARQKNVSRSVQGNSQTNKPLMVGMLSQFLPKELRESMEVTIDPSSKIGAWTSSGASVWKALDVVNKNNRTGINDLCELLPVLHEKFGGTPFDEKQKKDLVQMLGGQMIFPQQTEQGREHSLQAHNKIMNRLFSTGEDCEDIGNYICLVSSVMDNSTTCAQCKCARALQQHLSPVTSQRQTLMSNRIRMGSCQTTRRMLCPS